jgi:hypothetical protein
MEWSAIEKAYAIKADDRSRAEVLTEQAEKRNMNEISANFVSDIMNDLKVVFSQSKTYNELIFSSFNVITKGDRGIIIGVILVIISLSLLALHTEKKDDA